MALSVSYFLLSWSLLAAQRVWIVKTGGLCTVFGCMVCPDYLQVGTHPCSKNKTLFVSQVPPPPSLFLLHQWHILQVYSAQSGISCWSSRRGLYIVTITVPTIGSTIPIIKWSPSCNDWRRLLCRDFSSFIAYMLPSCSILLNCCHPVLPPCALRYFTLFPHTH